MGLLVILHVCAYDCHLLIYLKDYRCLLPAGDSFLLPIFFNDINGVENIDGMFMELPVDSFLSGFVKLRNL